MMGYRWFESEQPSEETKFYGLKTLDKVGWDVDYVLSHTAPLRAEPRHLFLEGLDQSKIDKSTEEYLDEIAEKLNFKRWFFGHYHGEWTFDKYQMLFTDIIEFPALEK
jgi:3-oxoacid CoA-transferase subunit A